MVELVEGEVAESIAGLRDINSFEAWRALAGEVGRKERGSGLAMMQRLLRRIVRSSAAFAGLCAGDEIIEVNNVEIEPMSHQVA